MNTEEISETIVKLRYQVSILGQTIDYDKHPVEALIISNNWGAEEISKAHDIFERWDKRLENKEKMDNVQFEREFDEELGVSYQGLKSVVNAFYKNGQWTEVCEAFVDSFGDSPSLEYHAIMRRER